MSSLRARTLLEAGHEGEWARLNAEKRRHLSPPPDATVEDLLRQGIALSEQATLLLNAVERAPDEHPRQGA